MDKINERLTFSSRESIVRKMQAHTGIEFNQENAYAVVLRVIMIARWLLTSHVRNPTLKITNDEKTTNIPVLLG